MNVYMDARSIQYINAETNANEHQTDITNHQRQQPADMKTIKHQLDRQEQCDLNCTYAMTHPMAIVRAAVI